MNIIEHEISKVVDDFKKDLLSNSLIMETDSYDKLPIVLDLCIEKLVCQFAILIADKNLMKINFDKEIFNV